MINRLFVVLKLGKFNLSLIKFFYAILNYFWAQNKPFRPKKARPKLYANLIAANSQDSQLIFDLAKAIFFY